VADVSTTDDLKGGRVKNRRRVLDLLRQNGGLSQADLSDRTGLSRATVSSLVSELRQHQLLTDEEPRPEQARIGRPPAMVALNGSVGAAVGVNITGESIQVAIGNVALDVLAEREVRPDQFAIGSEPDMTLRLIAATVQELLATARLDRTRVIGGAIGVPAPIDRRNGTVGPTTFLSNWQRSRPAEILEPLVGFPVLIENDANLAAYAEAVSGAVEGAAHVVFVGSGDSVAIGTGLIIQGRVYSGAFGGAGEIAHMVV